MLGVFLDLETNGLNAFKHRILEIAFQIIDLETGAVKDSYESIIKQPEAIWKQSDPDSLQVNGFTFEMIQKGKPEEQVSQEIIALVNKWNIKRGTGIFIGQNPSFDRMFFNQIVSPDLQEGASWPYHWLDLASMYWAKRQGSLALSKNAIAKELGLPEEEMPHKAMNGVRHLLACYKAVIGFAKASF